MIQLSPITTSSSIYTKGNILQLSPIFALGEISALGDISLAIIIHFSLFTIHFLVRATTEGLIQVNDCLHLIKLIGHLTDLGIEQIALSRDDFQIGSIAR